MKVNVKNNIRKDIKWKREKERERERKRERWSKKKREKESGRQVYLYSRCDGSWPLLSPTALRM